MEYTTKHTEPFQRIYELFREVSDFAGINDVMKLISDEDREALSELEKIGDIKMGSVKKNRSSVDGSETIPTYELTEQGQTRLQELLNENKIN
jgi:hypothetical protein